MTEPFLGFGQSKGEIDHSILYWAANQNRDTGVELLFKKGVIRPLMSSSSGSIPGHRVPLHHWTFEDPFMSTSPPPFDSDFLRSLGFDRLLKYGPRNLCGLFDEFLRLAHYSQDPHWREEERYAWDAILETLQKRSPMTDPRDLQVLKTQLHFDWLADRPKVHKKFDEIPTLAYSVEAHVKAMDLLSQLARED